MAFSEDVVKRCFEIVMFPLTHGALNAILDL